LVATVRRQRIKAIRRLAYLQSDGILPNVYGQQPHCGKHGQLKSISLEQTYPAHPGQTKFLSEENLKYPQALLKTVST